jgi:hypothetical protein
MEEDLGYYYLLRLRDECCFVWFGMVDWLRGDVSVRFGAKLGRKLELIGQPPRLKARQRCDRSNSEEENTRAIIFNLLWLRGTGEAISSARCCCRSGGRLAMGWWLVEEAEERERERQRWKRLVEEVERKKREGSGKSWGRIKGGKAPVREGNTEPREGSG